MRIILNPSDATTIINEYLDFSRVDYEKVDIYDNQLDTYGRHTLNHDLLKENDILLIIDHLVFRELYSWDVSKKEIIDFCHRGNQIWVWANMDMLASIWQHIVAITELDLQIPKHSIRLFFDAEPLPQSEIYLWRNIDIKIFPQNFFMNLCRIEKGNVKKYNCQYDFMLTMGRKKLPRDMLWEKLHQRPDLVSHGKIVYHSTINDRQETNNDNLYNSWVGSRYAHGEMSVGHPSMDLYNNAWIELLPETLCDHGHFFTEKTAKPISTKTTFVILATPGYLTYLKRLGFKTFNGLINESYDLEENLERRIDMIIDLLQDVINNGSEEFYHSCQEILDHNHLRLAEYTGLKHYTIDKFISENLNQLKMS